MPYAVVPLHKRKIAACLLITAAFILYLTLFPFDFVIRPSASLADFADQIDKSLLTISTPLDFVLNILMFVPLGFLLTELRRQQSNSFGTHLAISFFTGLLFSTGIEFGQYGLLLRHSALADVIANTVGACIGAWLNLSLGNRITYQWRAFQSWESDSVKIQHYLFLWAAYAVIFLLLLSFVQAESKVRGWDPAYPLLVGNERIDNRQWKGTVSNLLIADRALPISTVAAIFANKPLPDLPQDIQLSDYPLTHAEGHMDSTGNLPDLIWQGSVSEVVIDETGTVLKEGQWLETETAVTTLTNSIMTHSEFTVGIVAHPATNEQSGPARIVSISANKLMRNLTIGQEGDDLILRLRMPFSDENGRRPELIIPGVFADGQPHHLIITYDKKAVRFYIDTLQNQYSFNTTPSTLLFWYISPAESSQIRLNALNPLLFKLLFVCLWIVPTGMIFLRYWRKRP